MNKEIAIIGAGGFIGRKLTSVLKENSENTLHLYGKKGGLTASADIVPVDFGNTQELKRISENADLVYYLASETIPATSWDNPLLDVEKNLKPFLAFLEASAGTRLRKIVFISSAGTVYGTTSGKVKEEGPQRPFSPYGIIKLTMEHFLEHYHQRFGLQHDVFRVSNVYGAGQDTGKGLGIINTFLERIIDGKKLTVFGDGSVMRNYIYVDDVVRILALSATELKSSGIFNLASDNGITINKLVEIIRGVVSEKVEVEYLGERKSDNSFIDLDNSKILRHHPGFRFTELKDGISLTYNSLKTKPAHK